MQKYTMESKASDHSESSKVGIEDVPTFDAIAYYKDMCGASQTTFGKETFRLMKRNTEDFQTIDMSEEGATHSYLRKTVSENTRTYAEEDHDFFLPSLERLYQDEPTLEATSSWREAKDFRFPVLNDEDLAGGATVNGSEWKKQDLIRLHERAEFNRVLPPPLEKVSKAMAGDIQRRLTRQNTSLHSTVSDITDKSPNLSATNESPVSISGAGLQKMHSSFRPTSKQDSHGSIVISVKSKVHDCEAEDQSQLGVSPVSSFSSHLSLLDPKNQSTPQMTVLELLNKSRDQQHFRLGLHPIEEPDPQEDT